MDHPSGEGSALDYLNEIPSQEIDVLIVIGENRRGIEQDTEGSGCAGCEDPTAADEQITHVRTPSCTRQDVPQRRQLNRKLPLQSAPSQSVSTGRVKNRRCSSPAQLK